MLVQTDVSHLADCYFEFIARQFPVMSASDEFHFLPRAEKAAEYYHRLDRVDAESITHIIQELKQFKHQFATLDTANLSAEKKTDIDLIISNISGTLIELDKKKSLAHNPLLYLKIGFIGIDHALHKPSTSLRETSDRVVGRLNELPQLLKQGAANLSLVPESFFQASVSMTTDCIHYLKQVAASFRPVPGQKVLFEKGVASSLDALKRYRTFLSASVPVPDDHVSGNTLDACLKDHFMSSRTLDEIFQIGADEWHNNMRHLEAVGRKIDPDIPWDKLYHQVSPDEIGDGRIASRYITESDNLMVFFKDKGLINDIPCNRLTIAETPFYLRSVRGSASFAAALTMNEHENDFFYITTNRFDEAEQEAATHLERRLHREYKFLTAHETVPGHFLLDSVRRKLENPIRRQIESPLFYEGWATYAETLLADSGYVTRPEDRLVDFRRRLWRAARCQIDAGFPRGKLDMNGAVRLLTRTGFSEEEAVGQIKRFCLTPGYQLCYCLGSYEITKLKNTYGHRTGLQEFHDILLGGGELPFHLVEKRLEASLNPDTRSIN